MALRARALAAGVRRWSSALVAISMLFGCRPVPRSSSPSGATHSPGYVWKNVAIGGGGFVTGIVYHAAQRDLVYLRTDVGGAYRWNAAAGAWIALLDWVGAHDWNLHGIESLALDPLEPRRVYLAAGTYTGPGVGNGEILRSTDEGRTWARTPMPFKMVWPDS